uniref:Uncharacterized protein n=1 Tax=Arundo donax TaxID=35708 RepID=A0A0A8YNT6_ARUDO
MHVLVTSKSHPVACYSVIMAELECLLNNFNHTVIMFSSSAKLGVTALWIGLLC